MSASLPFPLAIFCASAIWFLTACFHISRKSLVFLCVHPYLGAEVLEGVALNGVDAKNRVGLHNGETARQEELLVAALLLDDLNQTGLQLLDRGNVVGQNTHLTCLCGEVDLDTARRPKSVIA